MNETRVFNYAETINSKNVEKREKIMHLRATNCTSNATYVILEYNFIVNLYLTYFRHRNFNSV